jgi:hypothetical protein
MRNWLRQRLINILVDDSPQPQLRASTRSSFASNKIRISLDDCDIEETDRMELPDPIRFKVQQVSGGTVVETRYYDYKKDEERVKLHIVTPEENLSESIGKIVTMELLQR